MSTKKIPEATEEVAEIFSLYCSDKLLSDDTPAFALYLAGYQAATSRQESQVKALVEALELVSPAEKSALDRAYVNGSNKGNTMTKQYQHWCKQCQRDTRNGHTPFCPATGVAS